MSIVFNQHGLIGERVQSPVVVEQKSEPVPYYKKRRMEVKDVGLRSLELRVILTIVL